MLTIGKVLQIPECSSPAADEIEKDIGSRRGRPIQLSDHKDYVDLCSSTQKVVEEIMDLFGDRIIRRHSGSLQYDGRPIIPLPPLHHVRLKLNMLAHDSQRYQQLMAADTKSKQQLNQFSRQVGHDHSTAQRLTWSRLSMCFHGKERVSQNMSCGQNITTCHFPALTKICVILKPEHPQSRKLQRLS